MYRCWLHTVFTKRGRCVKRDAALKKQSNDQLVVVISGREMSAMFGRVTFFLSLRVDVFIACRLYLFMFSFGFH